MKNSEAIKKVEDSISLLKIKDVFGNAVETEVLCGKVLLEFDALQKINDDFGSNKISAKEWADGWCKYVEIYKALMACKKLDRFVQACS